MWIVAFGEIIVITRSELVGGGSSLRMVPMPMSRAMVALDALESSTLKASVGSSQKSAKTETVIVFSVSPGAKVRTPATPL